ncbi:peptidase, partial [Actinomyces bowdenii]|nr:peptidase [Actinomyces bowdenii]NYS70461.1 peptidase [Actinomyces bowdenii]
LMPEPSPEPSPSGNVVPVLPTPSDTPTTTPPQSTGSLARTGANVLVALLVSGGVLVTGAIALAARRRAE